MVSINPAFQVLPTKGNQAILAAGSTPSDLKVGQLGVFSYATNLSIDGTKAHENKNFYIAVGIAPGVAAAGTSIDMLKSAGENIEKDGIRAFTSKPYVAPVDKVVVFTIGEVAELGDYALAFEIRNSAAYANYGFNVPKKVFNAKAGLEVVADSGVASTNELVRDLAYEINNDEEGLFTAVMLDPADVVVEPEDFDAWDADALNDDEVLKLQVSVKAVEAYSYAQINLNYLNPRGTEFIPIMLGFGADTTVETTVDLVYAETSGYDVQQLEYVAGGWNGNPGVYRESSIGHTGTIMYSDAAVGYSLISITNENTGIGGGERYQTSLSTIVAIPSTDGTTLTAVVDILNLIITGLASGAQVHTNPQNYEFN